MENRYSLGIGLNLFDARAVILREDNKVVAEVKKDRTNINANETLKVLLGLFEDIFAKAKKYKDSIEGVGLALGGIVNSKKGIVYWPQRQGSYISLPLRDYLEKRFGLPVLVENDASACAWAEHIINFPKSKNIVYMFSGVGCGIIADGKLYKGRDGGAGELFLNFAKVMSSRLGDFSFLRQWPADLDIVKRSKELISLGKDSSLITIAKEAVKEAAFSLGVKIAFLINLLNPDTVIIGGGLEDGGGVLLEECVNAAKKFAFNEMKKNCKISLSGLGPNATSYGAAMLVFK